MMTIDVETLRAWLEEGQPVTILDVRPTAERAEWAIPGSIHVDAYDALKAHDPAALAAVGVPSDQPVVTVCAAGKTSQIAAEQLAARGVPALSLVGGMKAWSLAWNTAEVPLEDRSGRVIQVRRTGKGCLSYLIGAGEEAFVIDASLDPHVYLNLARSQGWQITRVFDTHIHADHLSRSRQLAERSGAMLFLPDQRRVSFPFTALRDGDTLATEHLRLTALHTPGHTLESTCSTTPSSLRETRSFPPVSGVPTCTPTSRKRERDPRCSTTACTSSSRCHRRRSSCQGTRVSPCPSMASRSARGFRRSTSTSACCMRHGRCLSRPFCNDSPRPRPTMNGSARSTKQAWCLITM